MLLPLFVDLEGRRIVGGLNDPSPVTLPELTQGDTVDLILQGIRKNDEGALVYYSTTAIPFAGIKCAITRGADVAPTGGTIRLRLVGGTAEDLTPPFSPNIAKADLQDLLTDLPGVQAKGGLAIQGNTAANIFRIRWNEPGETALFEFTENRLEPRSEPRSVVANQPSGQIQALKIRQLPLAFTDQFYLPQAPVVTVASVRTGTGTRNCIQSVKVPRNAVGQVHFVFASLSTRILSVSGLTPTAVAGALNELYSDGVTRFAVTQPSSGLLYVEFVGPLELADQALLGVQMHDQAPLETPTARLPLDGADLELAFDGAKTLSLTCELEITDTDGKVGTPIQVPVVIRNDVIDGGMSLANNPDWQVPADPEYPPYDPANAAIVVQGSYIVTLGGGDDGNTGQPVGRVSVIAHNLGTEDLIFELRQTGGDRLRVPDDTFLIKTLNTNQVQIEFPAAQWPTAPMAGQVRLSITAVKTAEMGLPHHFHPISDINGLADILDALTAGDNPLDLWPNIPDSKLPKLIAWKNPDGTYRFLPIPDELIPSNVLRGPLQGSDLPPGTPYYVPGPPPAVVVTLPGPPPVTIPILVYNADAVPPTWTLPVGILPDPSTWPGLTAAIYAALQAGAPLPKGFVPMEIAALDETYPPTVTLQGTAGILPTLARALTGPVFPAFVSGALSLPVPDDYRRTFLVDGGDATADPVRYRAGRFFAENTMLGCDGHQYYEVFIEEPGGTAWPQEMERELFTLWVSERMLTRNCRFACSAELSLQLTGPAARDTQATYMLRVQFGLPVGSALTDVDWQDAAIEEVLLFSNVKTTHTFGVSVTSPNVDRPSGGPVLQAEASMYGRDVDVTAPVFGLYGTFALRAILTRFDVDREESAPVGQVRLTMKSARASVVDLSQNS